MVWDVYDISSLLLPLNFPTVAETGLAWVQSSKKPTINK